jgi:hypothetical protein
MVLAQPAAMRGTYRIDANLVAQRHCYTIARVAGHRSADDALRCAVER